VIGYTTGHRLPFARHFELKGLNRAFANQAGAP